MIYIAYTLVAIYAATLTYILLFCLLEFHLLLQYKKAYWQGILPEPATATEEQLPFVTVQLPIYNEKYVIARLIDRIAEMDYPKDRYEIHILDDSTDDTLDIVREKVAEYQAKGYQIAQITRDIRTGFKAGALRDGTKYAKGDFLAIFDADFMPRRDFLKATIPYFENPEVGVVQTRWEHINEDYSLITRLQALQLNVHFTVEQQGRKAGNYMLQFNGTAGVWRRATIDDAGGWEADTLTEDLDLSIRAQLKGWKIMYLEKFDSPAELPIDMNGLKSQQFRWMKGGAETAKKMLPTVWRSDLPLGKKIHATGHLMASTIFVFVFMTGVVSVPVLFAMNLLHINMAYFSYFLISLLSIIAVYYVGNVQAALKQESYFKKLFKFVVLFPVFLSLSMGLSLHNTVAIIQGYLGKKSAFIRTPKFAITGKREKLNQRMYRNYQLDWTTIFEGILAIYFLLAVFAGWYYQNTSFILFHASLALGYGSIFFYTVRHLKLK
ncbi:MAG: glycosyltransferase [Bacteroidota bacterium]